MTTPTITHLCLAGPRDCRAKVAVDNGRGGKRYAPAGTEKPDTLCPKCAHHVKHAIEHLPDDYQRLDDNIGDIDRHDTGEKVHGTGELPMPFNGHRDALMRDIVEYLRIAARRINGNDHRDTRPAQAVTACAALTAAQLDKLLDTPSIPEELWTAGDRRELTPKTGADIALKLAALHTQATNELEGYNRTGRVQLPYGCDACGEPNLYREGDKGVLCPNPACRKDWTDPALATHNQAIAEQTRKEEMELAYARWLAAEAQWQRDQAWNRLDKIATATAEFDKLAANSETNTCRAEAVASVLHAALDGHPAPKERKPKVVKGQSR